MLLLSQSSAAIQVISAPWHWSVSGLMLVIILFLLNWMGRTFGVSTIFRNICTLAGAGKKHTFFNIDLKEEGWRFALIGGVILGGYLAANYLSSPEAVNLSADTIRHLQQDFGMTYPQGNGFLPTEFFNYSNPKGIILTIIGGFLVGFGARYGKGCTSGHAITGLAHLQLPSLLTVIGFFIGGIIMTWLIMPLLF